MNLLADADLIQFIAMVVVLALVAISTWVRKTVEKMQKERGTGKEPIDVGKAVREQLNKYMRAAGQLPPEAPAAAPAAALTSGETVEPVFPSESLREALAEQPRPAVVAKESRFKSLSQRTTVKKKVARDSKFSPRDLKRAVVQAELLGPPIALRKDYRLF